MSSQGKGAREQCRSRDNSSNEALNQSSCGALRGLSADLRGGISEFSEDEEGANVSSMSVGIIVDDSCVDDPSDGAVPDAS